MKRTLLSLFICLPILCAAQSSNGINYQGVVRDISGVIIPNQTIGLQATIISNSPNGIDQYIETHTIQTNNFGLFNIIIGQGTYIGGVSDNVNEINWGDALHFLKIEMDVNGGTNYTQMGTSQFMTVPYSLYSEEAGKIRGGSSAKTMLYLGREN